MVGNVISPAVFELLRPIWRRATWRAHRGGRGGGEEQGPPPSWPWVLVIVHHASPLQLHSQPPVLVFSISRRTR